MGNLGKKVIENRFDEKRHIAKDILEVTVLVPVILSPLIVLTYLILKVSAF